MDHKFKRRIAQILNSIDLQQAIKEPKKEKVGKILLKEFEQELDKELIKYFNDPVNKVKLEDEEKRIQNEKRKKVLEIREKYLNLEICDEFNLPLPELTWKACINEKNKRDYTPLSLNDLHEVLYEAKYWKNGDISNPNFIWKQIIHFIDSGKKYFDFNLRL